MRSDSLAFFTLCFLSICGGCGTCDQYYTHPEFVETAVCEDLELGADCMPICEAALPGWEFRSCYLDNEYDCVNARVWCETSDTICK